MIFIKFVAYVILCAVFGEFFRDVIGPLLLIATLIGTWLLCIRLNNEYINEVKTKEYNKWEEKLKKEKSHMQRETDLQIALKHQLQELYAARNQTNAALQKLYNKNIIHAKYRGLIPIA